MSVDFDARVRARIAATGESKAQASAWVWANIVEPTYACARVECAHSIADHEDLGPDDVTHRCAIAGCGCPGYLSGATPPEATLPCLDCGVAVPLRVILRCWMTVGETRHLDEHVGLCCDCFDERQGMSCAARVVPRP